MSVQGPVVLVATDGSECAQTAIGFASRLAWPAKTAMRLVTAIPVEPTGPVPYLQSEHFQASEAARMQAATELLESAAAIARRHGKTAQTAVLRGRPSTAILEEAERLHADTIVLGSRGLGQVKSLLLGSVSAEVVDHAPCPVIVARGLYARRVVVAWDGSPPARRAAELLLQWPVFNEAHVTVVTVAESPWPWWAGFPAPDGNPVPLELAHSADAARAEAAELAHGLEAQLRAGGLRVDVDCREGDPAREIIDAARAHHAELVVMGTHGQTGLTRLLLGSVARNVLHGAPASVLVARARDDAPADA